jgi:PAS domain S-box-containing protein
MGVAIIGIPLILLILTVTIDRGFDDNAALRREVVRSYETRADLQRVLLLHQDIETGQRGFVITANQRFLGPYISAVTRVDADLARLSEDLRSDPEEQADLAALRTASAGVRDFAARTIALTRAGARDDARRLVAGGEGKQRMDRLRELVARISSAERIDLNQLTQEAEVARIDLRRRSTALEIVMLLTLGAAAYLIARGSASRQRALLRHADLSARLEAIFHCAKDGMIVLNPSGSMESVNPAAAKMFGYTAEALLRRDVAVLYDVAPDRGQVETFLRRLESRHRESSGEVQEFVGRRVDGTAFPIEVSISPVHLASRTLFLAVTRDITERRQIDQMKSEFVATVSHELRTPLTSIAGSLGLITGGVAGEIPPKALRLVQIAQANSARLVRLINDILDVEKIEAGRMEFDIRPVKLDAILASAVQGNAGFAAEYGVTIELAPVPAGAAVLADEDRLMQILTNLLSNAVKFSPRGAVVGVSVTPLDHRFRISVSDRGGGIPEAFHGRIFTKFAQADSSDTRQKSGTGLGLSIVREIATRLGGSVSFDSVAGEGAVFHVDLPAARETETRQVAAPPATLKGRTGLPRILHVDDDPDMLSVLSSVFEERAVIHSTPTLKQARAALRETAFDAAILDIGMEDGSGLDLVPELRQRRPDMPILVFTAQEVEPHQLNGVDLALVKSRATLDRLVTEAMRMVDGRHQEEVE